MPAAVVHANRVIAASPSAQAEGVHPGHRRREAQRACPGLQVLAHDPGRDARAFEPVLRALEAVTARLEPTRPGVVTFMTRGPARYHGGDERLAARVGEVVSDALGDRSAVGGSPGIGIADGRLGALLAARRSASSEVIALATTPSTTASVIASATIRQPMIVPAGAASAFLAPLPVEVLADPEVVPDLDGPLIVDRRTLVDLLVRLGLRSLGAFAELPTADVIARFGAVGAHAHRQAAGLDDRAPAAFVPPLSWEVSLELDPPSYDGSPVVFAAKALGDQLFARLAARGLACAEVLVVVETEHGERHERTWRRQPALTAAAVVERVRWQLDGWATAPLDQAPTAGITLLRLVPTEVVPDGGRQLDFWGGSAAADDRAWRSVARLIAQLGVDAVHVPVWRGGRGPAAPWALVPAATTDPDPAVRATAVRVPRGAGPHPGHLPLPLPAVVPSERLGADLLDGDGRSVTVTGRGLVSASPAAFAIDGRPARSVVGWAGPWPVEERWWDAGTARRLARFQITTDDGAAWLVAREAGRWWVEAHYR